MKDNKDMRNHNEQSRKPCDSSKPVIVHLPDFPADIDDFVNVPIDEYNGLIANNAILNSVKRLVATDVPYLRETLIAMLAIEKDD